MSSNSHKPRSIRDGGIAAAIGVALSLSLRTVQPTKISPTAPVETPWLMSNRVRMNFARSGFQIEETWGIKAGWHATSRNWRTNLR